ncbi:hypothetical protein ACLB2K_045035 [Fragaria x ananassa]
MLASKMRPVRKEGTKVVLPVPFEHVVFESHVIVEVENVVVAREMIETMVTTNVVDEVVAVDVCMEPVVIVVHPETQPLIR